MKPDTTNQLPDELLQRYFDGELSPEERRSVEAGLDADARLKLDALGELRGLLRAEVERTPPLDFSATFEAIARAPVVPVVVSSMAAPSKKRRTLLPLSAAGGLMAAAAALFLFLRPAPMPPQSAASVETLEAQGALASVFQVEEGSGHATVIWTDEGPLPGEAP